MVKGLGFAAFFSVFWVFFFGTKMVFSINCYMVFPLEHKIEHAGSMLSYAIIDSCSTWQMLAIFWEAVEGFGKKIRITGFIYCFHAFFSCWFDLWDFKKNQRKNPEKNTLRDGHSQRFPIGEDMICTFFFCTPPLRKRLHGCSRSCGRWDLPWFAKFSLWYFDITIENMAHRNSWY